MLQGPDERSFIQKLVIYTIISTKTTCPYYRLLDNGDEVVSLMNTASHQEPELSLLKNPRSFHFYL
jgi:hypothetical protein